MCIMLQATMSLRVAGPKSRRRLRLHPDEAVDHRRRREPPALEQELAREGPTIQFA
jgi:hypothetical protein